MKSTIKPESSISMIKKNRTATVLSDQRMSYGKEKFDKTESALILNVWNNTQMVAKHLKCQFGIGMGH